VALVVYTAKKRIGGILGKGVHDLTLTLGSRVGAIVAGVATQSILAWNLGPDGRGALAVCLLFSSILVLIFSVGCNIGAVYFVSTKRFSISEGLFYTFVFGSLCSTAAVAVGWVSTLAPLAFFDKATHDAFLLSLVLIPASLFSEVLCRLLTAVHLFHHFAVVTILRSVLQLVLTCFFVWKAGWGVGGALLASIITAVSLSIVCVTVFFHRFEITRVAPSVKKFLEMFSYGARLYVGKISNMANVEIGTVLLAFLAPQAEIGFFATASRLVKLVETVPQALTITLFPRMAADPEGKKVLVMRSARVVLVLCGIILLFLALFATPLVRIVFSPAFLPVVPLVRILAMGSFVYCMARVFFSYLLATDHPGLASIPVTLGAVVNVGLLWWLLPIMGVTAAAWAMSVNYFVSSAILLIAFSVVSRSRLREVFSFSRKDWESLLRWRRGRATTTADH
jgi:O-antigen/teichoic acid export membrane protein